MQKKWYTEFYSFDQDVAKSVWEKLKSGYELVINDPSSSDKNTGPLEHVFKVIFFQSNVRKCKNLNYYKNQVILSKSNYCSYLTMVGSQTEVWL